MDAERWKRVSRIAADAMELRGPERARYLDRACAGDAELRTQVERILSADAGFDSLLGGSAAASARLTIGASQARAAAEGVSPPALYPRPGTAGGASDARLPAELIERAARRLGTLVMLYAAGFLIAYLVREVTVHVVGGSPYDQGTHIGGQLVLTFCVALALAVWWVTRRKILPAPRLVALGLVFEVVGSLGIALASYAGLWQMDGPVWGVSWLVVWIMVFPLVVPGPPRWAAIAAFASAAMAPLAILIWASIHEFQFPVASAVLSATLPNFVVAVLAWFGSQHVYRIGLELREAKRLGRYRLVAPLGRGGMGEVWVAEHDLLARPAALKLVRPDLLKRAGASSGVVARFEREAQSTALLTSPHTVKLYDFGLTEDGLFYYVMELLDGLDLDTLVRREGPLPPERAIHLLRQACASLAEAHDRGLVHRDIKPSNLFVCRQGLEDDFVKVLDLGIVKRQSDLADDGTQTEGASILEGTPAFMAPEAARAGIATPRTDLYSLGCVGYWLVTGQPVFEAGDIFRALERHQSEAPVPPSQRSGLEIPAALEAAILSCLAKDPEARPASALALDAMLAGVPGPAWSAERARAWWSEHEVRGEQRPGAPATP